MRSVVAAPLRVFTKYDLRCVFTALHDGLVIIKNMFSE